MKVLPPAFGLTGFAASSPTTVVHSRTCQRVTAPLVACIAQGKLLRDFGRFPFEQQHGAIQRIRQRPTQHKFAARAGLGFLDVRFPKFCAPGNVVFTDFVDRR